MSSRNSAKTKYLIHDGGRVLLEIIPRWCCSPGMGSLCDEEPKRYGSDVNAFREKMAVGDEINCANQVEKVLWVGGCSCSCSLNGTYNTSVCVCMRRWWDDESGIKRSHAGEEGRAKFTGHSLFTGHSGGRIIVCRVWAPSCDTIDSCRTSWETAWSDTYVRRTWWGVGCWYFLSPENGRLAQLWRLKSVWWMNARTYRRDDLLLDTCRLRHSYVCRGGDVQFRLFCLELIHWVLQEIQDFFFVLQHCKF